MISFLKIFKRKKIIPHIRLSGVIGSVGKFKQGLDFAGQKEIIEKAFLSPLKYEDVPRFPVMKRDFALLIDKEVTFESLENISFKTERKILKSVQLFDVFEGEKLPKGKKSYGITFTFQDQKKTLTDKHIDKIMEKLKVGDILIPVHLNFSFNHSFGNSISKNFFSSQLIPSMN